MRDDDDGPSPWEEQEEEAEGRAHDELLNSMRKAMEQRGRELSVKLAKIVADTLIAFDLALISELNKRLGIDPKKET